jgi:hypothetical protein
MKDKLLTKDLYTYSRIAFVAIAIVLVIGCSGEVERRWSEEVALDDGETIVVERYVRFRESNSLAGDAYSSNLLAATLTAPEAKPKMQTWDVPLVPLVLYRDASSYEWVVVATTHSCDDWAKRGSPTPPYWEFRFVDGGWVQVPLSSASIGRKTNLFFDYEPSLPARHLTNETKVAINSRGGFGRDYLSVLAEGRSGCNRYVN